VAGSRRREIGGAAADYHDLGQKRKHTGKFRREREKGKGVLLIFEKQQTNEFKCKFEFKHTKPMHQHVCNIKLL
jgi:hypothetical protein